MDVLSWGVGLIAGLAQPSLRRAIAIGMSVSIAIRAYQYFLTDQPWGDDMPEDAFGAIAMLAVTAAMACVGHIVRVRLGRSRAQVTA
jgi:hypothetical protein